MTNKVNSNDNECSSCKHDFMVSHFYCFFFYLIWTRIHLHDLVETSNFLQSSLSQIEALYSTRMFSTTYNKEGKLWYGNDIPPLYNPNVSVAQVLLDSMTTFGPKIAQVIINITIKRVNSLK